MGRAALCRLMALVTAFGMLAGPVAADGNDPRAYTLDDVAWIAGHWQGAGLGGRVEEGWFGPAGGTMVGVFRLTGHGSAPVLEFLILTQESSGVTYRFKHFGPDYVAWEDEPITLRLTGASTTRATFENTAWAEGQLKRLVYTLADEATLEIFVDLPPAPFTVILTRKE